jgi:4-amino-4-deoxy-L-arabinose transferase-like glycosyltransferase
MHNTSRRTYLLGGLFVLALTALFAFANWHWLRANVVTYGWDRLDHLITSLVYRDTLNQVTPHSLLAALSYSDYYPPLVHYGAVLLYRLFGVDEDIAPMVNIFYLAVLLGATFWLAARWRLAQPHAAAHAPPSPPPHRPGAAAAPTTGSPSPAPTIGSPTPASATGSPTPTSAGSGAAFWTGALAATLLGLFPMIFAMSRYLYLDFALTALVALSIAMLLASARFDRRWPALGFGLALGLAFLVKWTTAAFVIGPLLYLVLRSGVLPYVWRYPKALLPNFKWLLGALLGGLGVIAAWFALAQDVVAALPLGWFLFVPLGLLLGGVFYALFAPHPASAARTFPGPNTEGHGPVGHDTEGHDTEGHDTEGHDTEGHDTAGHDTEGHGAGGHGAEVHGSSPLSVGAAAVRGQIRLRNMLGAGVVAAFIIALWYLTNIEFLNYFLFTAYGREDAPFYAFGKYLAEVVNEQLGPWFTFVFVAVLLVWVWGLAKRMWRQRPAPVYALARLSDFAWVLLLWVIVPYFVFSFRVTLAHSRFLMPFLPPFAIFMAAGLLQWRPKALRWAAITAVLLLGVAQYALTTFDELAPWRTPLRIETAGGPVNLLPNGFFIQYPTSGVTDAGYAVAPAILRYVDDQRQAGGALEGKEVANLGLLVNSYQVHEKHFLYPIYKDFPQVRLRELARNWSEQPAYNQLFDMDYVLVSDTHTFRTNENSQAAVQRILHDPQDAFNQAFMPVEQWTLPSGEQLTLYGRRFPSLDPGVAPADYQGLLTFFGDRLGLGDAIVLVSPDQVYMLGLSLPADAGAAIVPLPQPGTSELDTVARLEALVGEYNRIFLVSHNAEQVDPNGSIEIWLRANTAAANDHWAGAVRVTPFVPLGSSAAGDSAAETMAAASGDAARGEKSITVLSPAAWQDGPALALASIAPGGQVTTAEAGGSLVATLRWEDDTGVLPPSGESGAAQTGALFKASLQLIGADGALVAQEDRAVVPGEQHFVLMIPRSVPPGDYQLALVLYDPASGQRYITREGNEVAVLGTIAVGSAPAAVPIEFPPLRHPEDAEDEGS